MGKQERQREVFYGKTGEMEARTAFDTTMASRKASAAKVGREGGSI